MALSVSVLQVCNIDSSKRDAELWPDRRVDLHIVVHSLRQVPADLAESLLPKGAGQSAQQHHNGAAKTGRSEDAGPLHDAGALSSGQGLPETQEAGPRLIFRTDGPQALARGTPSPAEDKALFDHIRRCAVVGSAVSHICTCSLLAAFLFWLPALHCPG
jgi:hypothetical protein